MSIVAETRLCAFSQTPNSGPLIFLAWVEPNPVRGKKMKSALLGIPLALLGGCASTNLNNALGTPKNPTAVFVDARDNNKGEDDFLVADYLLLRSSIGKDGKTIAKIPDGSAKAYLEAGFNLGDAYCDRFLNKTVESAMRRRYGRSLTNDIGTGSNALLTAFGAGKDVIAAFAASFGFADSAWRNYDEAFLIAPELSNVQKLVRSAQENYKVRALGAKTLPTTYSRAQSIIRDYARYCTNLGMRSLINQSATEKGVDIDEDTKELRDQAVDFAQKPANGAAKKPAKVPAPAPVSPAAPTSQ
ncbi:hypothetical protein RZN05_00785 [Sphingomonas sp. HF-S4]|uniref:Lipoprotein n=1 Tax=Sphingomonas agrestis TaxID=3080540 RepID=A0ABU3Y343_9SPHN|nr:hypothetical protein [Sphingomonas sp. HF-S4]MDV3455502.1 hypothetical protein [Sphingomonas sp. HF-S4]